MNIGSPQSRVGSLHADARALQAVISVQTNLQGRIHWISDVRLSSVTQSIPECGRAKQQAQTDLSFQRRVGAVVLDRECGHAIVDKSVAAAEGHFSLAGRIPGEAQARIDVVAVGRIELRYKVDLAAGDPLQLVAARAQDKVAQCVLLVVPSPENFIAHAEVQSEVAGYLPVVLKEQRPFRVAHLREHSGRQAGGRTDQPVHLQRFIVGEIQNIGKRVRRDIVGCILGRAPHAAQLAAHF